MQLKRRLVAMQDHFICNGLATLKILDDLLANFFDSLTISIALLIFVCESQIAQNFFMNV